MLSLFGPILAQAITLSVVNRTEARAVADSLDPAHSEGANVSTVALSAKERHFDLRLSYSPYFMVTTLETEPDPFVFYQNAAAVVRYTTTLRRNTFTLSQTAAYSDQNLRVQALAGTATPFGQPGTLPPTVGITGGATGGSTTTGNTSPPVIGPGTVLGGPTTTPSNGPPGTNTSTNNINAVNREVHAGLLITAATFVHRESALSSYGATAAYTIGGALRTQDKDVVPVVQGPLATLFMSYGWNHRDRLLSSFSVQYSSITGGDSVWLAAVSEAWAHRFDKHTNSVVGIGLSGTRVPVQNYVNLVAYSIYPTALASINYTGTVARGNALLSLNMSVAPTLDLGTLLVDPRFTTGAAAAWSRRKFWSGLTVSSTFSTPFGQQPATQGPGMAQTNTDAGTLQSVNGALILGYRLAQSVSVDTGTRVAWQTYQGNTTLPFSYAVFAGLSFGAQIPFN